MQKNRYKFDVNNYEYFNIVPANLIPNLFITIGEEKTVN